MDSVETKRSELAYKSVGLGLRLALLIPALTGIILVVGLFGKVVRPDLVSETVESWFSALRVVALLSLLIVTALIVRRVRRARSNDPAPGGS